MLNDFQAVKAFIDYKEFGGGQARYFEACLVTTVDRDDNGDIAVFLNFKQLGRFKKKSEALALVKKLLAGAPRLALSDFEEHKGVLLDSLR